MKIASQLLNTTPGPSAKSVPVPESGVEFHSVLTKAVSQRTSNAENIPLSGERQIQQSKKRTSSTSYARDLGDDPLATATTQPATATSQIVTVEPTGSKVSVTEQGQSTDHLTIDTDPGNEIGMFATSASDALQFPADPGAPSTDGHKTTIADARIESSTEKPLSVVDGETVKQDNASSKDSQFNSHAVELTSEIKTSILKPDFVTFPDNSAASNSRKTHALNPIVSPNVDNDASKPSAQQVPPVVDQGATATMPLAGSSASSNVHVTSAANAARPNADNANGTRREKTSDQNVTATKAKPGGTSPAVHEKGAEDKDNNSQTPVTTGASASFVKILDDSSASTHKEVDPSSVPNASLAQQVSLTAAPGGSSHIAQTAPNTSASADTKVQAGAEQALSESHAAQGITSAQLTQSMRSSEMKLGMQSTEFGNISISTSLNHQAISAQISIDHTELGRALAVHLPAIEEKLGSAYGVQAKVELRENNQSSSSNDAGYSNTGGQSREQRQRERGASIPTQGAVFHPVASRSSFAGTSVSAESSRLDIRI